MSRYYFISPTSSTCSHSLTHSSLSAIILNHQSFEAALNHSRKSIFWVRFVRRE
ncbi:hypothetical protein YC2023_072930 [Brassica napus]